MTVVNAKKGCMVQIDDFFLENDRPLEVSQVRKTRKVFVPRAEVTLTRKLKLSQVRARRKQKGAVNSDTQSNMNFSAYKQGKVREAAVKIEPRLKEEVAPLRNPANSLLASRFSIENASKDEIALLKKKYSRKIVLHREIGQRKVAKQIVNLFKDDPDEGSETQELHVKELVRLLPARAVGNPFLKMPQTTNQQAYQYKLINEEELKL